MLGININGGRFEFGTKIGSGSFGSVYYGLDTTNDREVAIKVEASNAKSPQLEYESKLYKVLGSCRGLPTIHWYGQESGCSVLVLDLLGPSLQDLLVYCDGKFSLKTVLQLGHQVLDIIQYVHSCCFLHRDLKPANFLVGRGENACQVHLIDFGLAKRFYSSKSGVHIPYRHRKTRGIIGSARYASVSAHEGKELSRRDDIESLAYMLIHFMIGTLPWQFLDPPPETKEAKNLKIGQTKAEIKAEVLCAGLPACFSSILMSAYCLDFEEMPDYKMLHKFLKVTADRESINCDGIYDWTDGVQEGEVVQHCEEDDRLSCNLSQVSIDSAGVVGDQSGVKLGITGGRNWSQDTSGSTSKDTGGGTKAVGPLMRVATKGTASESTAGTKTVSSASLMRAMQSAGVDDGGTFMQTVKKNFGGEEEEEDGEGGGEGRDGGERARASSRGAKGSKSPQDGEGGSAPASTADSPEPKDNP